MVSRKLMMVAMLVLLISGCSSNASNIKVKDYTHKSGITFNYPEEWIVTDVKSGADAWLVVSKEDYSILKSNKWPNVTIFVLKPDDINFVPKQLESLKEINDGNELNKSTVKINGKKYTKYETEVREGRDDSGEPAKAKLVYYALEEKDISVLIETADVEGNTAESYKDEIKAIVNSIKI